MLPAPVSPDFDRVSPPESMRHATSSRRRRAKARRQGHAPCHDRSPGRASLHLRRDEISAPAAAACSTRQGRASRSIAFGSRNDDPEGTSPSSPRRSRFEPSLSLHRSVDLRFVDHPARFGLSLFVRFRSRPHPIFRLPEPRFPEGTCARSGGYPTDFAPVSLGFRLPATGGCCHAERVAQSVNLRFSPVKSVDSVDKFSATIGRHGPLSRNRTPRKRGTLAAPCLLAIKHPEAKKPGFPVIPFMQLPANPVRYGSQVQTKVE